MFLEKSLFTHLFSMHIPFLASICKDFLGRKSTRLIFDPSVRDQRERFMSMVLERDPQQLSALSLHHGKTKFILILLPECCIRKRWFHIRCWNSRFSFIYKINMTKARSIYVQEYQEKL